MIEKDIIAAVEAVRRIPIITSLLDVVCNSTGMGFAAVARVTEHRWVACSVRDDISFGLKPGGELKIETTICNEIRSSHQAVVIDDVSEDSRFCNHPTPLMYGFQSYISVPIMLRNGHFFGTLCAIDPRPARLNRPEIIGMFNLFAELISFHLYASDELELTEKKLAEEQKTAELREQFIAVLGHDLRTPVTAASNSAELILRNTADPLTTRLAGIIRDSSLRMKGLIDNVMDFARGRMGGGINLIISDEPDIATTLEEVIDELRMIWPGRVIETIFTLDEPVHCDTRRIAQLFSNLLVNALNYGDPEKPIRIKASSSNGAFTLSVRNAGNQIPAQVMECLFKPFSRGELRRKEQGLGLGLYIASEIALAHHGRIEVVSTEEETSFTLLMPSRQPANHTN